MLGVSAAEDARVRVILVQAPELRMTARVEPQATDSAHAGLVYA